MFPRVSHNNSVQEAYERMRRDGQSHNMAEMLACRSVPGIRTDSTFMRDANARSAHVPLSARKAAKKAGVSTDGKVFMTQLADSPNDPKAWVSGKGDIKRICETRGWSCEGAVNVKGAPVEHDTDADYRVADDLVMKAATKEAEKDPGLVSTKKRRENLIESTREKLQPKDGGM
jgi:hypothetical protein